MPVGVLTRLRDLAAKKHLAGLVSQLKRADLNPVVAPDEPRHFRTNPNDWNSPFVPQRVRELPEQYVEGFLESVVVVCTAADVHEYNKEVRDHCRVAARYRAKVIDGLPLVGVNDACALLCGGRSGLCLLEVRALRTVG